MQPAQLRRLRIKAGLSQEELATRIGYSRKTIHRWENGLSPIPKLAEHYLKILLKSRKK